LITRRSARIFESRRNVSPSTSGVVPDEEGGAAGAAGGGTVGAAQPATIPTITHDAQPDRRGARPRWRWSMYTRLHMDRSELGSRDSDQPVDVAGSSAHRP
jgi:hypothetical protein